MTTILNGKKVAAELTDKLKKKVKILNSKNIMPTLCVIEVGDDPASKIYLRVKRNLAHKIGIKEKMLKFPAETSQEELLAKITELNKDPEINGIMVQLPVPSHIDKHAVVSAIDPKKDVDGFHPYNQGRLWQGINDIIPATVRGILTLLDYYKINVAGKKVLVIGRSLIVGRPVAGVLLTRDATVTIAHKETKNLSELTKMADIIISDVGKAHLVKADMIKDGCVIIDVGMNRENGKLMGDVEFDECAPKTSAITPVPGGVGPLTVACLMEQTLTLTEKQQNGR